VQDSLKWSVQDSLWSWPNGATLKMRYLESATDWMRYWGHAYTWIGWDELPNWPDMDSYVKMKARLRSAYDVPNKRIRATGNPGGPGHSSVKAYFRIDQHPLGGEIFEQGGMKRLFVRSRLADNRILLRHDPKYAQRLAGLGSPDLVRAWLEGDWNVIAGAFFPEFGDRHIVDPIELPSHWTRFRAMDWGSAKPFSVGWYAVSDGELPQFPRGALIKYREWYGMIEGQPNTGLKMTATEVGKGIVARQEKDELISYSVLDPSAFAEDGGPSIAEMLSKAGAVFRAADNKRITQRGAMGGWDQVRGRLKGDAKPMLYFFSTCTHTIRTLPALQHDVTKPEDVDTDAEDHCFAADTMIAVEGVPRTIASLVGTSGRIHSKSGLADYRNARLTRRNARVVRIWFADGTNVVCTPDHRFMLISGDWKTAEDLTDETCYSKAWSSSSVRRFKNSTAFAITAAVRISSAKAYAFIVRCGKAFTGPFQMDSTSITWTTTEPITSPRISNSCSGLSTLESTAETLPTLLRSSLDWSRRASPLLHGMEAMRANAGIASTTNGTSGRSWGERLRSLASSVASIIQSLLPKRANPSSVTPIAKHAHCVRVERLSEPTDVYCLTVPDAGCFALASGVIVSNCGDETRYACMSRPWTQSIPADSGPPRGARTIEEMVRRHEARQEEYRRI